jgi:lipopolysaccharide biosynthesis glycosyltransferase
VVATDAQFALPTAVTLRSLWEHMAGEDLHVVVLHDDVDASLRATVDASLPPGAPTPRWVQADLTTLGDLPPQHLPPATWFRLLALEVVPPDVERVVYLDVDVLIRGSLSALWSVDLAGRPVGAVRSVNYPSIGTWGAFDHWRRYGIDPQLPFFNAGLLVIDAERWRAAGTSDRIVELLGSGDIRGGDQQALNVALAGCWQELDPMWNQQTPLLDDAHGGPLLYDLATLERARRDPLVIHFLDRPKPWHVDSTHPARGLWRAEAARTAFAPVALDRTSRFDKLRRRAKRAASALVHGT